MRLKQGVDKWSQGRALGEKHKEEKDDEDENHRDEPPELILPEKTKETPQGEKPDFRAPEKGIENTHRAYSSKLSLITQQKLR